jgi:MscS family membrane protein
MDFTFYHKLDVFLLRFPLFQQYDLLERLAIVLIYVILAKILDLILIRSLRRVSLKTRMHFDDFLIDFFHRPFLVTVILLGVLHACSVDPPLPHLSALIIPNLSKTLIILAWWGAFSNSLSKTDIEEAIRILGGRHIDTDIFLLFKNVTRILILFFAILWILLIWKVNLAPLFASAGIVGIAIALAAKDTLANFFGGISVFMDRAYKVGEYIILESGERGEVVEVGIRSTKIQTRDDVMITIPNGIMANSKIINESAPQPRFRIRLDIGVAYGTDLDMVEDLLLQVAGENNQVVKQPSPRVRLRTFGDSAVNFQLLLWIRDPREKGRQTHLLLKEIYRCFTENNVSIPFPQRDVYIREQVASNTSPAMDSDTDL